MVSYLKALIVVEEETFAITIIPHMFKIYKFNKDPEHRKKQNSVLMPYMKEPYLKAVIRSVDENF